MFVQLVQMYVVQVFDIQCGIPGCHSATCLQDGGKFEFPLDGLFGLPRKKSAGVSYMPALHGSLFFLHQGPVDDMLLKDHAANMCFKVFFYRYWSFLYKFNNFFHCRNAMIS